MKPPAPSPAASSEVAAYVANCFGDMESDIDRIVATALAEAGVPTPDAAAGAAAAAAAASAAASDQQAAAALPADTAAAGSAGGEDADAQQLPEVMLSRRLEESLDAYDPPADNPVCLPEALGDEPATPAHALEQEGGAAASSAGHALPVAQPGQPPAAAAAAGTEQDRGPAERQHTASAGQPIAARLLKQRPQSAGVAGPQSPSGAPAASKFPLFLSQTTKVRVCFGPCKFLQVDPLTAWMPSPMPCAHA